MLLLRSKILLLSLAYANSSPRGGRRWRWKGRSSYCRRRRWWSCGCCCRGGGGSWRRCSSGKQRVYPSLGVRSSAWSCSWSLHLHLQPSQAFSFSLDPRVPIQLESILSCCVFNIDQFSGRVLVAVTSAHCAILVHHFLSGNSIRFKVDFTSELVSHRPWSLIHIHLIILLSVHSAVFLHFEAIGVKQGLK